MFKYEKFSASRLATSPSVERVVEFSPPGVDVENIVKVLSLGVEGKAIVVTANDGFAEVEGRANFKLIYIDPNNMPKGVDYNADFSVKVSGDFMQDDTLTCQIDVVEADVVAKEMLTLSAVLEVSVAATKRVEMEALVDAEKCFKTVKKCVLPTFVASKSTIIPIEDEVSAKDVGTVLLLDSCCTIKKAVADNKMVRVDGAVFANITFTEGEEILTKTLEISLCEEVAIEGVESGDMVSVDAMIKGSKIVLQGVSGDNIIRFEGELVLKIQVHRSEETDMICDLFMLTNEVELKLAQREFMHFADNKYFSERVSGTAMLSDNRAAAREIVALPYARCYTSKSEVSEDGLTVEGIVNTDIIYSDENGYNSVRTEIPFSMIIAGEFEKSIKAHCMVESISARVKRDREIEVTVKLCIMVAEYKMCAIDYIEGVLVGNEKPQNMSALSLYIASSGDQMWDVCKALTATPEEIMKQNPTLQTPLADGEKIVFFRALTL